MSSLKKQSQRDSANAAQQQKEASSPVFERGGAATNAGRASAAARARSGGAPMPGTTQQQMEGLFGRDFSSVRVHESGVAESMGARAVAKGNDLHFAKGAFQPDTRGGQFLLGHELAHVVQQDAGQSSMQAKDATGARTGDSTLEAEADRVGHAVSRGESVAGTIQGRTGAVVAQRFESDEHAEIGDDATKGSKGEKRTVELAKDYRITFGEMVAMAGDFFADLNQMRTLAKHRGTGAGTREEIEYVRVVKVHGRDKDEEKYSESARKAADKRYLALAANNRSHFLNPRRGDTKRSTKDKLGDSYEVTLRESMRKVRLPSGSLGYYRQNHLDALASAAIAGKKGVSIDSAMASEGFACHYLTDMFAAGHIRTPRASISHYWNAKVPMFFHNLKGYLAERLAKYINDHNTAIGIATVDLINDVAMSTLEKTLEESGIPELTFGDLVSGAVHDYDNEKGISATSGGAPVKLYGDGHLHEGDTKSAAVAAVKAGVGEVERAYTLGKSGTHPNDVVKTLLSDGLFAAEKLAPVPKPDSDLPKSKKSINWRRGNFMALLNDGKFQHGLMTFLKLKKNELSKVGKKLDAAYKREAFEKGVLAKLDGFNGVKEVAKIVQWTPNTGGGVAGHNQDDNAYDYYKTAKAKGALHTLTWVQRVNLIANVLSGATVGGEESMIINLLKSANESTRRALIKKFGWKRLHDEIDDWAGEDFAKTFPKSKYGS